MCHMSRGIPVLIIIGGPHIIVSMDLLLLHILKLFSPHNVIIIMYIHASTVWSVCDLCACAVLVTGPYPNDDCQG